MAYMAYKFRMYPNTEQENLIIKTFGCVRFIYNKMFEDKIKFYECTKKRLNNTPAQYKKEYPWLREVDAFALCNAQIHLQAAYNNFFKNPKSGFPKFKSKKTGKNSYTTNNHSENIRIVDKTIKLPKLGMVKIKQHREIKQNQKIKSVTITRKPSGKYFVSILVEYNIVEKSVKLNKEKSIGLDYSSHSFYVDSQGVEADYPRFYRASQDHLSKEQRKLATMKKGSNNYYKQKVKIATIQEKIANQRKDWMHKLSTELSNKYDYICVEDINLQQMSQHLNLGKSTYDNGFGMFRDMLFYKLKQRGKKFIKIDKWYPSSKMCRYCGTINSNLTLSQRVWTCECGKVLNRDENAAINILNAGLSMI